MKKWKSKTWDEQLTLLLFGGVLCTLAGLLLPWLHLFGEYRLEDHTDQFTEAYSIFRPSTFTLITGDILEFSGLAIVVWIGIGLAVGVLLSMGYFFLQRQQWTFQFTPITKLLVLAVGFCQFIILALGLLEFQDAGLVNPYMTMVWEVEGTEDFMQITSMFGAGVYLTIAGFLLLGPALYVSSDLFQNLGKSSNVPLLLQIEVELQSILQDHEHRSGKAKSLLEKKQLRSKDNEIN